LLTEPAPELCPWTTTLDSVVAIDTGIQCILMYILWRLLRQRLVHRLAQPEIWLWIVIFLVITTFFAAMRDTILLVQLYRDGTECTWEWNSLLSTRLALATFIASYAATWAFSSVTSPNGSTCTRLTLSLLLPWVALGCIEFPFAQQSAILTAMRSLLILHRLRIGYNGHLNTSLTLLLLLAATVQGMVAWQQLPHDTHAFLYSIYLRALDTLCSLLLIHLLQKEVNRRMYNQNMTAMRIAGAGYSGVEEDSNDSNPDEFDRRRPRPASFELVERGAV